MSICNSKLSNKDHCYRMFKLKGNKYEKHKYFIKRETAG